MSQLGAALIEQQQIAQKDLERAQARQVLYGLDLPTNLIEVAVIDETRLTHVAAEAAGLKVAPTGELQPASAELRSVLPSSIATKLGVYPLERSATQLVVAVSEPLDAAAKRELGATLELEIEQICALSVRIRQAISKSYGLPLDRRTIRAIAKLEGRPDPMPSVVPAPLADAPTISALPQPASNPQISQTPEAQRIPKAPPQEGEPPKPVERPRVTSAPPLPRSIRPNEVASIRSTERSATISSAPRSVPSASRSERAPARGKSVPTEHKHHRGPYTTQLVGRDLRKAGTTSEALGAFFDFAAQYFEYAALFAVHDDIAEGRDAHGPGLDRSQITTIGVPLDIPSLMSRVRDEKHFVIERLSNTGLDASLAKDLKRGAEAQVLILPIAIHDRTVLLFYGDEGKDDVSLKEIGEVLASAPLVASALERILVQRKRTKVGARATPPSSQRKAPASSAPAAFASDAAPDSEDAPTRRMVDPLDETRPGATLLRQHPLIEQEESGVDTPRIPSVRFSAPPGSAKRRAGDIQEDDWDIPEDPMPSPSPPPPARATSFSDNETLRNGSDPNTRPITGRS